MDHIRLRTCTKKSVIGQYIGAPGTLENTVERWLKLNPGSLIYKYFCVQYISFTEDVLKELSIKERIKKPGIDHIIYEKYKIHGRDFNKRAKTEKGMMKVGFHNHRTSVYFNKIRMQALNQGH